MVEIGSQHAVRCPTAIGIGLLVADKYIERLFLLRDFKNALLDFVDGLGLGLVDLALSSVGILDGGLVVLIIENGGILGAVHRRHALVRGRILHVLNAIAAQYQ